MSSKKKDKYGVTLHEALVALQKSFSRVSRDSSQVSKPGEKEEDKARALMIGAVDFELTVNIDIPTENKNFDSDYIYLDSKSPHSLKVNGSIELDIRAAEEKAE